MATKNAENQPSNVAVAEPGHVEGKSEGVKTPSAKKTSGSSKSATTLEAPAAPAKSAARSSKDSGQHESVTGVAQGIADYTHGKRSERRGNAGEEQDDTGNRPVLRFRKATNPF